MNTPHDSAPQPRPLACALLIGYVALSPVVFWYGLIEPFEASKSALTQLTALALVVLGVSAGCGRLSGAPLRRLFSGPIGTAILAGVVAAVLSTVFSISPRTSLLGALDSNMGLVSVAALAVLFAASRALARDEATAERTLGASVIGMSLSCAYAVVQVLGFDPVRWATGWEYRGWLRPTGTLGHPNYLSGYAVMVLPVVLWHVRQALASGHPSRALAGTAVAVLAAVSVTFSLSRSALLAGMLAVAVLLVGWRTALPRRRLHFVLLFSLLLGLAILVGWDSRLRTVILARIAEHVSSPGRWPIWAGAWQLFVRYPWTGSGLDTFGLAWPGVRTADYWEVEWGFLPVKAHNDFLHALATQGIVGATAHAMLPLALCLSLAKSWRSGRRRDRVVLLGSMAVAFYVQNLFGFAVASTAGLLAVVAGMAAALDEQQAEPTPLPGRVSYLGPLGCAGIVWVLVSLWQGGGESLWRLALVALVLGWAAKVALLCCAEPAGLPWRLAAWVPQKASWRLGIPAVVAVFAAWWILAPLLGSALSFRAEQCRRHDPDRALACHNWAVRLAPQCPLLHQRRALSYWLASLEEVAPSGKRQLLLRSRESIETACRMEPFSANFQAHRARILFEIARGGWGDPWEVPVAFDRAVALDRCNWFVVADAASAALTLGYQADCQRHLDAGLDQLPTQAMLLAERGALERARGQLAAAEQSLRLSLESPWHGEQERFDRATLVLATVLWQTGRFDEAMHLAQAVLARHSDWTAARLLCALIREQRGQKQVALDEFRRIVRQQPEHAQARAGIARLARAP